MFASAKATGWDPATNTPTVNSVPTAIDAMVTGVTSPSGATFKVPLSTDEVATLKADAGSLNWVTADNNLEYSKPNNP